MGKVTSVNQKGGITAAEVNLKPVKDKKKLPPKVEHKVLTKEEIKKIKKFWTEKAKLELNKKGGKSK